MFYRALALMAIASTRRPRPARDEHALQAIRPGAFAAWAEAGRAADRHAAAPGAACQLPDGRTGRLVEVIDGGGAMLVCQSA